MKNKFWNDWEIVDKIGEGSFGTVYKAIRNDDGCVCAIKHISLPKGQEEIEALIKNGVIRNYQDANNYFINSMKNEIEVMKRFNGNPYIIDCYDIYQENKEDGSGVDFYIRMEYVEDLKTYLATKKIDIDDVVKLGIDICSAIELCTSINIVHNDIKPGNIFVGDDHKYKLGDFGISSIINNQNSNNLGTLNYIAPEIYNNKGITSATDVYSLGLVMYKLINGELPFVTKNIDEKSAFNTRMTGEKIPVIHGLNKQLMEIITKACAFNVSDRYQNATDLKRELQKLPHINSKKKLINFASASSTESTIGIYEKNLSNNQNNLSFKTGNKLVDNIKNLFNDQKKLKNIIGIIILFIIIILLLRNCSLNRKCDIGYINKNGHCVKGYYYCGDGYTLNADNKCQKTLESIDAKVTYTCKSGYTLNGEVCVSNDVKDPQFVYKCADGFTLNGTKCEKIESADAIITYSCSSGYILSGDKCVTVTNVNATSKYVCKDSTYTLSGTICKKNVTKTVQATQKYVCDSNGTLNGTVCDYTVSPSYSWPYYKATCSRGTYNYLDRMCHYSETAKLTYYCSQGTSDGVGNCKYSSTETENATIQYSCPSGYTVVGNQCAKTSNISAIPKYTCADGTTLKGKKCYATVSTDAVGMYACEDGYVASGTTCYKDDFPSAIKKYTCSRVYTLNGGKCEKYEIIEANAHYEDEN